MNEVTDWILSDDLFLHIGRYWYPLHITQIVECVGDAVKIIAEAIRQSIQNFMDTLPNICIARADDDAEQYEMQLRTRWKPVRYIRASDRRTGSYAINTIRKIKKEQRRRRR